MIIKLQQVLLLSLNLAISGLSDPNFKKTNYGFLVLRVAFDSKPILFFEPAMRSP